MSDVRDSRTLGQGGRRHRLTEERRDHIVQALKAGNYAAQAMRFAGISEGTYYSYLRLGQHLIEEIGEEGVEPADFTDDRLAMLMEEGLIDDYDQACIALVRDIDQAKAEAEVRFVTQIAKAGQQDWRASLALLERIAPQRWRPDRTVPVHVSAPDGGAVQVETRAEIAHRIASDPEARRLSTALLARVVPAAVPGADHDEEAVDEAAALPGGPEDLLMPRTESATWGDYAETDVATGSDDGPDLDDPEGAWGPEP